MGLQRQVFRIEASGIVYDVPPDAVPEGVFTAGNNVTFRDGLPERAGGYREVYPTPIHEPEWLLNNRQPLVNYWIYPGMDAVGVTDGLAHFDISPAAPLIPTSDFNQWTGGILNGIAVLNNEWNNPLYWDNVTSNDCAELPGWPAGTKCKALRPFKYHLFALNVSDTNGNFPDTVFWSDAAEPGDVPQSWTPLASNQAGFASLSAGGGGIVDAVQLRDTLVIFKNTSTWVCNFIGGNDVFAFRKVLETSGALSKNCAVEIKGNIVVLTDNDLVLFDGQTAQSIIDKRNRQWLFDQIDAAHFLTSFVCKNWLETEVWVCFPSNGSDRPNKALVWSRDDNTFGIRDIYSPAISPGLVFESAGTATWENYGGVWGNAATIWDASAFQTAAETLLASVDGLMMNYSGSNTENGVNIEAFIQKAGIALGDPQTRKLIKRIWPRIEASNGTEVFIRAGASDQPNGPITWAVPVSFLVGQQEKIDTFAQGRYLAIEVASYGDQPWRMTGFDCEFSTTGAW